MNKLQSKCEIYILNITCFGLIKWALSLCTLCLSSNFSWCFRSAGTFNNYEFRIYLGLRLATGLKLIWGFEVVILRIAYEITIKSEQGYGLSFVISYGPWWPSKYPVLLVQGTVTLHKLLLIKPDLKWSHGLNSFRPIFEKYGKYFNNYMKNIIIFLYLKAFWILSPYLDSVIISLLLV